MEALCCLFLQNSALLMKDWNSQSHNANREAQERAQ